MLKRITSVILILCMVVSVFAGTALSADALFSKSEDGSDSAISGALGNINIKSLVSKSKKTFDKANFVGKANLHIEKNLEAGLEGSVILAWSKIGNEATLYLPGSADTASLFLSWDDEAITLSKNGTIYENGKAPIAAANESVTYKVSNGKSSANITIKTLKGSTGVNAMFLDLDETMKQKDGSLATIDAMNASPDHETKCYGTVSYNGQFYQYMSMKGRGNSTWGFDKRPYNITFHKFNKKADEGDILKQYYDKKESTELIAGVKAKSWSLLANYLDSSLMRNKVGLDLANELGIGLTTVFVDLYMNGEYLGNYLMTPKNDYQKPDNGYILENDNYLSTDIEEPQFTMDGMWETSAKLPIIDGYYNRITIKDVGDDAYSELGLTEDDLDKKFPHIEEHFKKAWAAVLDYDSEEYQKYFDVDSWAKMYLMYEVCKTYDAFSGSILMHRDGTSESDPIIAGPTWDMDTCLGRTMYKFLSGITLPKQLSAEGWYIDSIGLELLNAPVSLLQELGKHPSFKTRMAQIFHEEKAAFDNLPKNIEKQRAILKDSALMNNDLWGTNHLGVYFAPVPIVIPGTEQTLYYKVTSSWDAYIDNLYEFATKRIAWLTNHFVVDEVVAPTEPTTDPTVPGTSDTTPVTPDTEVITPAEPEAKEVALTNGTLTLVLDGKEVGEFTFEDTGYGWTIKDANGKYLATTDGKSLARTADSFIWQFDAGVFSAKVTTSYTTLGKLLGRTHEATAYLATLGNALRVSNLSGSTATFLQK